MKKLYLNVKQMALQLGFYRAEFRAPSEKLNIAHLVKTSIHIVIVGII